ncbi:MAG: serine/threonine protein kinase, partial [Coleofasciculus sp. S288]|nr:serine/threonine protein kinase [Coleofasciculus sp. S288]
LTQELQPGQRWEESRVIELLEEVLSILAFVHQHGVIHRDIKPDNLIRRNSDRKLVLVDFGAVKQIRTQLATAYGAQASATIAVGTPGYMASEQALGQPRPSSDIYALAIIGIQALTGLMTSQFEDDLNTGELLWQHRASVSPGLAMVLTKMVRYHFKDRYQSAAEALQALRQLNSPYASTSYPTTPAYPSVNDVPPPRQSAPQPSYPTPPSPPSERRTLPVTPPPPPPQPVVSQPSYERSYEPARRSNSFFPVFVSMVIAVAAGVGLVYGMREGSFASFFDGDDQGDRSDEVCTVTAGALNVRSEPQGNVVNTVRRGTNLSLTGEEKGEWVEINSPVKGWVYDGGNGYINCTVATQEPAEPKTQPSPTPVETKPSPSPVTTPTPKNSPDKPKPADNGAGILAKAAEKYQSGDLQGAIADAQSVLPSSADFQEAQAKIEQWQRDWNAAQEKYNNVQKALDEGKYIEALLYAADAQRSFPEQRYWRERLNQLIEDVKRRKAEADAQKPAPSPTQPTPSTPTEPVTPSPTQTEAVPGT